MAERSVPQPPARLPRDPRARVAALRKSCRAILNLPPAEALMRILDAPQPAALVHAMAPEDLYLLVNEIGPDDALPLMALASQPQWDFFADVELWRADRFDAAAASRFLDYVRRADPVRLTRWLLGPQRELLELFLAQRMELHICEEEQESSRLGEDFQTLDGVHYFRVRPLPAAELTPAADSPAIEDSESVAQLLTQLANADFGIYRELMPRVKATILAEAEETAYRWRSARLAERGLVSWDEAVQVYAPLEGHTCLQGASAPAPASAEQAPVAALYPLRLADAGGHAFNRALLQIEAGPLHDRLAGELACLCNHLVVADRRAIRERGQLAEVVGKASGFLSVGLEHLMQLSGLAAHDLIRRVPLINVFRAGYTLALELRQRAVRWRRQSWFAQQGLPLSFWDEQGLALLGGLLLKRPLWHDAQRVEHPYREFALLTEVRQAHAMLDTFILIDELCARLRPAAAPLPSSGFLTWKMLLLTLWARSALQLDAQRFGAIALDEFRPFFGSLWSGRPRRATPAGKQAFIAWLVHVSRLDREPSISQTAAICEALYDEMGNELAAVRPEALDPRYVRHFWLSSATPSR